MNMNQYFEKVGKALDGKMSSINPESETQVNLYIVEVESLYREGKSVKEAIVILTERFGFEDLKAN